MDDRRNWKCLIGMHQLIQVGQPETIKSFDYEMSKTIPSRIIKIYVMKCEFCGKIVSERIEL